MNYIIHFTGSGLDIPGAYLRVTEIEGDDVRGWWGTLTVYASKAYHDAGGEAIRTIKVNSPALWVFKTPEQIAANEWVAPTNVFNPDPMDAMDKKVKELYPNVILA